MYPINCTFFIYLRLLLLKDATSPIILRSDISVGNNPLFTHSHMSVLSPPLHLCIKLLTSISLGRTFFQLSFPPVKCYLVYVFLLLFWIRICMLHEEQISNSKYVFLFTTGIEISSIWLSVKLNFINASHCRCIC